MREVFGDMPFMPGDQDRLNAREVLVECGAADAGLLGDLRHGHRAQPVLGDKRRGGLKDGIAYLATVRLDRLVPELGNHGRTRDGPRRNTLYCTETLCLDKAHLGGAST
jgi:hypothetical protein